MTAVRAIKATKAQQAVEAIKGIEFEPELKAKLAPLFEEATVKGFFKILLNDGLISNEEYVNCMKDCKKLYGR